MRTTKLTVTEFTILVSDYDDNFKSFFVTGPPMDFFFSLT